MVRTIIHSALLLFLLGIFTSCEEATTQSLPEFHLMTIHDEFSADKRQLATATLNEPMKGNVFKRRDVEVKYRGNFSMTYPKKSYSIKFLEEQSVLDLGATKTWFLQADYIDKTFIRNKLSYHLYRQFSEKNVASQSRYCLLYLNGKAQGVYEICQKLDEQVADLRDKNKCSFLFKDLNYSIEPDRVEGVIDNLTHFYNNDPRFGKYDQSSRDELIAESFYDQKYPDPLKSSKKSEISELMKLIHNSSDKKFENEIFQSIDFNSLIDWHLLLLLSNNGDGVLKNYYLKKNNCSSPIEFIPWDYEHGYGRDGDGEPNRDEVIDLNRNALIKRVLDLNVNDYCDALEGKYLDLRKSVLTEAKIFEYMDQQHKLIAPFIEVEQARWPLEKENYFKSSNHSKEFEMMKAWISNRLLILDSLLITN